MRKNILLVNYWLEPRKKERKKERKLKNEGKKYTL